MRQRLTAVLAAGIMGGALVLAGCSGDDKESTTGTHDHGTSSMATDHSGMDHAADGGPAPADIQGATNPKYAMGTMVTLSADHMPGMKGVKATITGAFHTFTYSVSYTPTTGGARVTDHRWVVQEELKDSGDKRLADGTEVTLLADHMKGMKGAKATIDSSTDETVYMVDFEAGGMMMTNHKWVVESEIQPAS
ncbi:MAG: YdhK family protein [Gordonia amarae]